MGSAGDQQIRPSPALTIPIRIHTVPQRRHTTILTPDLKYTPYLKWLAPE